MSRDYSRLSRLIECAPEGERAHLRWCASALTIPGNLAFLDHGLELTLGILDRIGPAFEQCFGRFAPETQGNEPSSASAFLRDQCERLLSLSAADEAPSTDLMRRRMEGKMGRSTTPLHGKSVDSSPYWASLFYMVDPEADRTVADAYERLTDLVLIDLWTVSARLPSAPYFAYLEQKTALEGIRGVEGQEAVATRISKQLKSFISGTDRSRIRSAARVVRKLSDAEWRDLLMELSSVDADDLPELVRGAELLWWERLNPDTFAEGDKTKTSGEAEILSAFDLLVRTSRGHEGLHNRTRRSSGSGRKSTRHTRTFLGFVRLPDSEVLFDEPETDGPTPLVAYRPPRSARARAEDVELLGEMNIGPDDDPARGGTLHVSGHVSGSDGRLTNTSLASRQIAKRLRKIHARMRSRSNALSARAIRALGAWCAPCTGGPRIAREEAWLKIALGTGRLPDSTCRVSILGTAPSGTDGPDRDEIQFLIDRTCWRIPVPAPAFADLEQPVASVPVQGFVDLPDLLDFAGFARANQGSATASSSLSRLPTGAGVQKQVLELARDITGDAHLPMSSLSGWLFDRLIDVSHGDMALATMLTGRSLSHSRTLQHYSVLEGQLVMDRYRQAIAVLVPDSSSPPSEDPMPAAISSSRAAGANRVPSLEAMQRVIGRLKEQIAIGGEDGVRALVNYTQIGFHLGTGARPIAARYFPLALDVLPVVVLTEKAPSPYYENPVPLAKPVHAQLGRLVAALRALVPGWDATRDSVFPLLGPDLSILRPLRPMDLDATMIQLGFDIELYGLRRFLRSQLMRRNVHGEDIDALMGHWFDGASPWDPLSTYAPKRLFDLVNGPVSELLAEIGFVPVGIRG